LTEQVNHLSSDLNACTARCAELEAALAASQAKVHDLEVVAHNL